METVAASVIAVLGTLLGAGVTYVFQGRSLARAESFARNESLRQERLNTYSRYGGALAAYRGVMVNRWYSVHENRSTEEQKELRAASHARRAEAQEALYRVLLITESEPLSQQAQDAFDQVTEVRRVQGDEEIEERRRDTRESINDFIVAARRHTQQL
ncbi:hypothetical protein [Streptomyces sp. NPDC127108]|uniref:hypothetical protein n=1 Tax=Streptomyces sp. NPDC127108 TaxID=3345361 RepID=UPI0036304C33